MTSFITLLLVLALASSGVFSRLPHRIIRDASEDDKNEVEDPEDTDEPRNVTDTIEAANAGMGRLRAGPTIEHGDIAINTQRNAAACTARGCKWPKGRNGFVYVPFYISYRYSDAERRVIVRSLKTFHSVSCIRFDWRRGQRDYLYFYPFRGCWSSLGRRGGRQRVSLQKRGCVYTGVIQHEIIHALGFHHEQSRSDRDKFVTIVPENIRPRALHNFRKANTNNLGTPYDYTSVMHYSRFAFSKQYGVLPTIVPTPDSTVAIGQATKMSANDIKRINLLYQCSGY